MPVDDGPDAAVASVPPSWSCDHGVNVGERSAGASGPLPGGRWDAPGGGSLHAPLATTTSSGLKGAELQSTSVT